MIIIELQMMIGALMYLHFLFMEYLPIQRSAFFLLNAMRKGFGLDNRKRFLLQINLNFESFHYVDYNYFKIAFVSVVFLVKFPLF